MPRLTVRCRAMSRAVRPTTAGAPLGDGEHLARHLGLAAVLELAHLAGQHRKALGGSSTLTGSSASIPDTLLPTSSARRRPATTPARRPAGSGPEDGLALVQQEGPQGAGAQREHHVVDGGADGRLISLTPSSGTRATSYRRVGPMGTFQGWGRRPPAASRARPASTAVSRRSSAVRSGCRIESAIDDSHEAGLPEPVRDAAGEQLGIGRPGLGGPSGPTIGSGPVRDRAAPWPRRCPRCRR